MSRLFSVIAFIFAFSISCNNVDLPTGPVIVDSIVVSHFMVAELNVFQYPNQVEMNKQLKMFGVGIFVGHNKNKGLPGTVVEAINLGQTNAIYYVKGSVGACGHEFGHAQESLVWDNTGIAVNQVCF